MILCSAILEGVHWHSNYPKQGAPKEYQLLSRICEGISSGESHYVWKG